MLLATLFWVERGSIHPGSIVKIIIIHGFLNDLPPDVEALQHPGGDSKDVLPPRS